MVCVDQPARLIESLTKAMGKDGVKMRHVKDLIRESKDLPPSPRPVFLISSAGHNFTDQLLAWLEKIGLVKGNAKPRSRSKRRPKGKGKGKGMGRAKVESEDVTEGLAKRTQV